MLSRNNVSPATSWPSEGIHKLMLPCVCPGVYSTWNSVAPTTSLPPSIAGASISTASGVSIPNHPARIGGGHRVSPGARRLDPHPPRLHLHHLLQFGVVGIHVDGRAGGLLQLLRTANMVDVRMRDDDPFHRQTMALQHL